VDGVLLLTSELVTNTIVHTGSGPSRCAFAVTVVRDHLMAHVEVGVTGSASEPKLLPAGLERDSGRRLAIVRQLAQRRGYYDTSGGRVVWFDLE
jgi:hypothetical protein